MKEYDIYVPLFFNDGTPVSGEILERLGEQLLGQFGGCTFFPQPNKGMWKVGDVVFHDAIVIFRVLSRETRPARRFLRELKQQLLHDLRQEAILIVEKSVESL